MEEHPIILFDGVCNFCSKMVNFIISQDKKGIFRFAPLQSIAGCKILETFQLETPDPESFILIHKGKVYKQSTAALKLYGKLPWYWKWTQIFWLVPAFIRNKAYAIIARNRYKWFGKKVKCMVPGQNIKQRFIVD